MCTLRTLTIIARYYDMCYAGYGAIICENQKELQLSHLRIQQKGQSLRNTYHQRYLTESSLRMPVMTNPQDLHKKAKKLKAKLKDSRSKAYLDALLSSISGDTSKLDISEIEKIPNNFININGVDIKSFWLRVRLNSKLGKRLSPDIGKQIRLVAVGYYLESTDTLFCDVIDIDLKENTDYPSYRELAAATFEERNTMDCRTIIKRFSDISEKAQRSVVDGIAYVYEPAMGYLYIANTKTTEDGVLYKDKKDYKFNVDKREFTLKDAKQAALSVAAQLGVKKQVKSIEQQLTKVFEESLSEADQYGIILDILSNDDVSSDKEIIALFSDETKFDKDKLEKLVKAVRSKFLKSPIMDDKVALKLIKKYI